MFIMVPYTVYVQDQLLAFTNFEEYNTYSL